MVQKLLSLCLITALVGLTLTGCSQTGASSVTPSGVSANTPSGSGDPAVQTESTTNTDYTSAKALALTEGQTATLDAGGYYSFTGTLTNGQLTVDTPDQVFIELAGVAITNNSGPALQITNAKEVTLTLKAGTTNTLTDGGTSEINAALFSNDTLIIEGNGALVVTGNNEHGIESDDDVIINGGNITIAAKNDGIHANDNITINSGLLNVANAVEGVESKGDIVINNGVVTISGSDDCINAAVNITINGGQIYAKSTRGDALDSNGTININGGTTVALGANQPEAGIDSDQNRPIITGGTLIAGGGSNSLPSADTSTQYSVNLSGPAQNSLIHLESEDGAVLTFAPEQNCPSLLFSSPLLGEGKTYTIFTGGTVSGGTEFHGLYHGATYSGGTEGESFTISSLVTMQGGDTGQMGGGGMPPGGRRGNGMDRQPMDQPPMDRPDMNRPQ